MMKPLSTAMLIGLAAAVMSATSQNPPPVQAPPAQQAPPAPPAPPRPGPPTRDPLTPGYVKATELPDGAVPPVNVNGNFIIGPTHPASPDVAAKEGVPQGTIQIFTMSSADSKIYPGIAREPGTGSAARSGRSRAK